jgi:hypothetical protein
MNFLSITEVLWAAFSVIVVPFWTRAVLIQLGRSSALHKAWNNRRSVTYQLMWVTIYDSVSWLHSFKINSLQFCNLEWWYSCKCSFYLQQGSTNFPKFLGTTCKIWALQRQNEESCTLRTQNSWVNFERHWAFCLVHANWSTFVYVTRQICNTYTKNIRLYHNNLGIRTSGFVGP